MHVIDIKKSPLTWKGGEHWPDAGYRVKGNSDALQSAHSYISWKALFWIFREARSVVSSSFLSALVDCPGPLLLQGPTCQATPVWTLRTGAEFQEGRPEWWGSSEVVRAGLGARRYCGLGLAESTQTPAKVFPVLHSPPAANFTVFLWSLPFISTGICPPLVHCSTRFRFLCAILVSGANVQFWNCLATEADKVKITEESQNFRSL